MCDLGGYVLELLYTTKKYERYNNTEVVTVSLTADLLMGLTARDNLFIIAGGKVQMHHFVKSTSCKREA